MPEEQFFPNSPAFDIAELLMTNGIANTDPNNVSVPLITVGFEPRESDEGWPANTLLSLYDIGGMPSNPAWERDTPRIQVRVKGDSKWGYPTAFLTQQKVKGLLLGMERIVINKTLYVGAWQQVDIASLAPDYNERPILVSSYRLVREYSTQNRKCIK